MRGLIIDEPWISFILAGRKTWEMRKGATNIRGQIALIRKGSGSVVGVAELTNSLPDLNTEKAYAALAIRTKLDPYGRGRTDTVQPLLPRV